MVFDNFPQGPAIKVPLSRAVIPHLTVLWTSDPVFQRLCQGVDAKTCVEGSVWADNARRAQLVRDRAVAAKDQNVAVASLSKISEAVNKALHDRDLSRVDIKRRLAATQLAA